jgi:transposase
MKKEHVKLSDSDRETLTAMLAKGTLKAKAFKRATGLLELDRGKTFKEVSETLNVNYNTVSNWSKSYDRYGIKCLLDKPRSGRPIVIDGEQRAQVTALACRQAPEGHARWDLRLLAGKVVELGY